MVDTIEVLKMLEEYYDKPLAEGQARIYVKTLEDIHPDVLEAAAYHLIKTGHPFMPKVAELRRAANEVMKSGEPENVKARELVDPNENNTELYWLAMDAFNRGDFNDSAWKWFERVRPTKHPGNCHCAICSGEFVPDTVAAA